MELAPKTATTMNIEKVFGSSTYIVKMETIQKHQKQVVWQFLVTVKASCQDWQQSGEHDQFSGTLHSCTTLYKMTNMLFWNVVLEHVPSVLCVHGFCKAV